METKHSYDFDASWNLEKLGSMIIKMESGTKAEVVNDEAIVYLGKDVRFSYATGGPTGLVALKVVNHASPNKPHCADTLLKAAEGIAKDSWADHIDYSEGERWIREIFFKLKEVVDAET